MGQVVQAAKITHVPTIWMSHTMPEHHGLRTSAIEGYDLLRAEAMAAGVETFIVFDTHWIVNQGYHVNAKPRHVDTFTSHELPHMLAGLDYDYEGDTELAEAIVDTFRAAGERAIGQTDKDLGLDYGTLLPMHFINKDSFARVLPVAVNQFATIAENIAWGKLLGKAIATSGRKVSVLASGSLSHSFWGNADSQEGVNTINGEFNRQMDLRVLELWEQGRWPEFMDMLPEYAEKCSGECAMNDTAMLFGLLGGAGYEGHITTHTPYFPSSGTGQVNISFSLEGAA